MRNEKARVSDPKDFVTNPGNDEKVIYSSKVLDDGSIILTPSGKQNVKEYINSFVDQTDIAYIIRQLQLGDTSVLNSRTPMYDDFTGAPKDLRQAMQIMLDGERAFYDLPLDTRQKFDNDFRKWLVSAGSDDWAVKMFGEKVVAGVADQETKDSEGEKE